MEYGRKQRLIMGVATLVVFCVVVMFATMPAVFVDKSPHWQKTVLLDAGHGGRDGGCVGANGSIEKELNLAYTLEIKRMLEDAGVRVVLTRAQDEALYSPFARNKKIDDMQKRVAIIKRTKPDLYISIHMNSTSYTYRQGAQVYYGQVNDSGKCFAELLAKTYNRLLPNASPNAKSGDLYILDQTNYAGVLVECGFLSNAEEEANLLTKEYRQRVAYATFCGVMLCLGLKTA